MGQIETRIFGDGRSFGSSLLHDLGDTRSLSVAVAFAKNSALGVVNLEAWCERGKKLRLVAGTDFALTELDLLTRIGKKSDTDCRVYHSLGRGKTFHPKLYVLEKGASRVVYIGSSNFTRGGLAENIEANVRLEGPPGAPEIDDASALFETLFDDEHTTPISPEFEQRYDQMQRLQRSMQAHPEVTEHRERLQTATKFLLANHRARVAPSRWFLVTSMENFDAWLHHSVWGQQQEKDIRGYASGDIFFLHVRGGRGIVAVGSFVGAPFRDDTPLGTSDSRGNFPWRIKVHLLMVLPTGIPTEQVLGARRSKSPPGWFKGFARRSHSLSFADFYALLRAFEEKARMTLYFGPSTA